jgi:hypothetical protein
VHLLEEDVRRLQIAVNDARAVRDLQRLRDVADDPRARVERQRPDAGEPSGEVLAPQKLHGEVRLPLKFSEIEHLHDVRAAQLGCGLSLPLEALERSGRCRTL